MSYRRYAIAAASTTCRPDRSVDVVGAERLAMNRERASSSLVPRRRLNALRFAAGPAGSDEEATSGPLRTVAPLLHFRVRDPRDELLHGGAQRRTLRHRSAERARKAAQHVAAIALSLHNRVSSQPLQHGRGRTYALLERRAIRRRAGGELASNVAQQLAELAVAQSSGKRHEKRRQHWLVRLGEDRVGLGGDAVQRRRLADVPLPSHPHRAPEPIPPQRGWRPPPRGIGRPAGLGPPVE